MLSKTITRKKMAEIIVSMQAYAKMLLHTAKYPHCAVNGVLLVEDNKLNKEKKQIRFVDCIPLFHLSLSLAPMLEAALLQIDSYCRSKGLTIGGYYQANEHIDDDGLNNVARHIGKKIQEFYTDACVFVVNNRKVSDLTSPCYSVHTHRELPVGWKKLDERDTVEEDSILAAATLVQDQQYRQLIDFDNHFDDVKNDWRNLGLNEVISKCT